MPVRRQKAAGWLTHDVAQSIVFVLFAGLLGLLSWLVVEPLIAPMGWAFALAIAFWPLHSQFRRLISNNSLAAVLTTMTVGVTLILPIMWVGRELGQEAVGVATTIQASVKDGSWQAAIERRPVFHTAFTWVGNMVDLKQQFGQLAEFVPKVIQKVVTGSLHLASGVVIALFLLFFFLRDQDQMLARLRSILPFSEGEVNQLFGRIANTINAIFYGTLAVALLQGILGAVVFWWLGLPAPLLWGAAMAVVGIVPMVGTAIIWGPAALYLLLEGNPAKALALSLWGLLVIGLIDNFLQPVIVDRRLQIHVVPVFISLVGGLYAFGAVGLIVGPVVLTLAVALLEIWRNRIAVGQN